MSKPILLAVGFLLLGFATGIGAGLYMGSASPVSGTTEKSTAGSSSGFFSSPEAQNQVEANTLLSNRIIELEKELAAQKEDQKASLADRIAFFKKFHERITMQAFDGNLKMTPEMAELLGLSVQEQQAIEQHMAEVKSEMDRLEESKMALVKQVANGITLEVPANTDGLAIKARLNGLLAGDIGDDRAQFLMDSGGYGTNGAFFGFDEQKRDIEITWADQNGSQTYTVKDISFGPNNTPQSWTTSSSTSLSPQYQKYLQTDSTP
jgi:hypothetical protein